LNRRKWIIVAVVLVVLAGAAEFAVQPWKVPKGCVQIVNQGDAPIEDLVLSYAGTKVVMGRLGTGQSGHAWFTGDKVGPLILDFKQKGNPMSGFQIADFDPGANIRDGLKLVLFVKNDQIQRSVDDDDTVKARENLIERVKLWLFPELKQAP
jgi:hypothetical protein